MSCSEHQRLFQEETEAWSVWRSSRVKLKDDDEELSRLERNASQASDKVRDHLATCRKCKGL
jgi:hypothetical protein